MQPAEGEPAGLLDALRGCPADPSRIGPVGAGLSPAAALDMCLFSCLYQLYREGREKSKAGRGSRKKTERGRISGDFGYPISGGKEEEERTVRKADGNIGATSRWTQVDSVMKDHTLQECYATNSSISSQMDFS